MTVTKQKFIAAVMAGCESTWGRVKPRRPSAMVPSPSSSDSPRYNSAHRVPIRLASSGKTDRKKTDERSKGV